MKNRKPFFRFCKGVMRIFKRKPKMGTRFKAEGAGDRRKVNRPGGPGGQKRRKGTGGLSAVLGILTARGGGAGERGLVL